VDIFGSEINEKDIIRLTKYYSNSYKENVNLYGGHNFVYLIKGDIEFVLRATPKSRRTLSDIESELDFMTYLKFNGVFLPAPLKGFDNKFAYETELYDEIFIISAFEKANALNCAERGFDGRERFVAAGKMLGKIHKASKKYIIRVLGSEKTSFTNRNFFIQVPCHIKVTSYTGKEAACRGSFLC
jgi:Ser/Thr protein kinase RdoA (MazF antagonist)